MRKEIVLKRLCVKQDEVWGKGLLIFAPIIRHAPGKGLKCRFLPLLDIMCPIDKCLRNGNKSKWSKEAVNSMIVDEVKIWIKQCPFFDPDSDQTDRDYLKLVTYLSNCTVGDMLKQEDIRQKVFPEKNFVENSLLLRRAESAKLVSYQMKGLKRLRYWVVNDICNPNYQM